MPPDEQWELLFTACCPQLETSFAAGRSNLITVAVSPLAALMEDQVTVVSQRIVRAAYIGVAKEDAEVAKDKGRKLPAGVFQS